MTTAFIGYFSFYVFIQCILHTYVSQRMIYNTEDRWCRRDNDFKEGMDREV
jgi:hypothetical protein